MRRSRSWDRSKRRVLPSMRCGFWAPTTPVWPAVARPHPFLTRSLQRTHNMPHADSTADWKLAQQVTTRLERSTAKCIFSYPSQNADGVCRPSTPVSPATRKVQAKELRLVIAADESLGGSPALLTEEERAAIVPWPIEQNAGGAEILRSQAAVRSSPSPPGGWTPGRWTRPTGDWKRASVARWCTRSWRTCGQS